MKIEASAELARYTSWRRIDLKRMYISPCCALTCFRSSPINRTFQLVHMQLAGYHILEKIEERCNHAFSLLLFLC